MSGREAERIGLAAIQGLANTDAFLFIQFAADQQQAS